MTTHDLPETPKWHFAAYVEPYGLIPGVVSVEGSNIREALLAAAELPLVEWFPPERPEPKLRVDVDDEGDVYVSREDDLEYPYNAWEGLIGRGLEN